MSAEVDTVSYTVLVPADVKRNCVKILRGRGETGATFYWQLFAAVLFLLLKDCIERMDRVTIDIEYPGRERDIKRRLLNLCREFNLRVGAEQIHFAPIGKRSPAHHVAIQTFRGKRQPDRCVTEKDVLSLVRK